MAAPYRLANGKVVDVETSSCTCFYDKDSINLTINCGDEINLEANEVKKIFSHNSSKRSGSAY